MPDTDADKNADVSRASASGRDLVLSLLLDAPRRNIWRCWTEAELLKQWFAPKPWTTPEAQIDVRVGGASYITMASPEGQTFPNPGIYLEVIPERKLVFTDAFGAGWAPKDGAPFIVGEIALSDEEGKTRYVATVRHWTREACEQHDAMGFHAGWTTAARQLEALASGL